jgi:uncharacterized DUF497 family protein
MEFERDPDKNEQNIGKHGIDFVRAKEIFGGPYVQRRSDRRGKRRWIAVGPLDDRLITVVFTRRSGRIRIISARRASSYERKEYCRTQAG